MSVRLLLPESIVADRYRITDHIASGGMANVYLAYDILKKKNVALKILHEHLVDHSEYIQRFFREARLMMSISSRNVMTVSDLGRDQEIAFIAIDYVPGYPLDKLLDRVSLISEEDIAYLLTEISKGLLAIHKKQIIYRDLKPANILLSHNGEVLLTDFGIAKEPNSRLTQKDHKLGSICYIAPEVWFGKKLTSSVDMYSLGIVAYELTTSKVPFESPYPGTIMQKHISEAICPPTTVNPGINDWLNTLIVSLLEKDPDARPHPSDVINLCGMYCLDGLNKNKISQTLGTLATELYANRNTNSNYSISQTSSKSIKKNAVHTKQYTIKLDATRNFNEIRPRRSITLSIPISRQNTLIFSIEKPSRDIIYLGVFLASLQVFDGMLTVEGLNELSIYAEGNTMLRFFMARYGLHKTIFISKSIAVIFVIVMTVLGRRIRWVRDAITVISVFYLIMAIIPWLIILRLQSTP